MDVAALNRVKIFQGTDFVNGKNAPIQHRTIEVCSGCRITSQQSFNRVLEVVPAPPGKILVRGGQELQGIILFQANKPGQNGIGDKTYLFLFDI